MVIYILYLKVIYVWKYFKIRNDMLLEDFGFNIWVGYIYFNFIINLSIYIYVFVMRFIILY